MIKDIIKTKTLNEIPYGDVVIGTSPECARELMLEFGAGETSTGRKSLGEIVSYRINNKTIHICVCFSLHENGFRRTPQLIKDCLIKIDIPEDEVIAVTIVGNPAIKIPEEKIIAILAGIAQSNNKVVFYTP